MNENLKSLYLKYWDRMQASLSNNQLSNPLLLNIKDEGKYRNADIKVMIFGQETNSWEGDLGSKSIDDLMNTYADFFGNEKCYTYGGQFWNSNRHYIRTLKEKFPNKKIEVVWNNIVKFGKVNKPGAPTNSLVNLQKELFPVIKSEMEILQPDLVIFFTGPNYDKYITLEWEEVKFEKLANWNKKKLVKLKHYLLPEATYRTYHPNYLYRSGKAFYSEVRDTIFSNFTELKEI